MSHALPPADLDAVDLPKPVWARSKLPFRGTWLRITIPLTLAAIGLALPWLVAKIALIVVAAVVFIGLPMWAEGRLDRLAHSIGRADGLTAAGLASALEKHHVVALFARHGWVALQRGRLHLRLRDGRAAAHSFSEAARLCGDVDNAALLGAQAHALGWAGDRKEARRILVKLEGKKALSARDRLNLATAYLEEPNKIARAVELLDAAREQLGDHPRVLAALAIAQARHDMAADAAATLALLDAGEGTHDELTADLIKRARKEVRSKAAPAKRRKKGQRSGKNRSASADRDAQKKDRRKDRHAKSKSQADSVAADPVEPVPAPSEIATPPKTIVPPAVSTGAPAERVDAPAGTDGPARGDSGLARLAEMFADDPPSPVPASLVPTKPQPSRPAPPPVPAVKVVTAPPTPPRIGPDDAKPKSEGWSTFLDDDN